MTRISLYAPILEVPTPTILFPSLRSLLTRCAPAWGYCLVHNTAPEELHPIIYTSELGSGDTSPTAMVNPLFGAGAITPLIVAGLALYCFTKVRFPLKSIFN